MKRAALIIFIICIIALSMLVGCKMLEREKESMTKKEGIMEENLTNITIIDVYDNVEFDPKFETGFGFGCVIKFKNNTILFDTGSDSPTLLKNLEMSGIKPEAIDIVVLSHIHADHTGGLLGFLERNSEVKVYVPESFPSSFKEEIKTTGAEVVDVSNSIKIIEGVYSTGELGTWIKEQSLIINSDKGLVVITGCAHPGVVNIVKKAKELLHRDVYIVMGGFHNPSVSVVKEFRKLGVKKVAPSHCTGDVAIKAFEEEYKEDFVKSGVGRIIKV